MFFILKSAFWLSIVFYCMAWPSHEQPQAVARQAAGELASRAQAMVVEKAADACSADMAACLAMMRKPVPSHGDTVARARLRGALTD